MSQQNCIVKTVCSEENCTGHKIMVSPCVPVPFPLTWVNKRWRVSNLSSSCVEGQYAGLDSPPAQQTETSREAWHSTIVGYKILEERSKFTIFKILATDSEKSWVIFRRYSDFYKLNDELKKQFPNIQFSFPQKYWYKNKFDEDLLKLRQTGLQLFLKELSRQKSVYGCETVRRFLHMVNSPDLYKSPDESLAFCEMLEEMNHRLQRALSDKQREVDNLKKAIESRQNYLVFLMKRISERGVCS